MCRIHSDGINLAFAPGSVLVSANKRGCDNNLSKADSSWAEAVCTLLHSVDEQQVKSTLELVFVVYTGILLGGGIDGFHRNEIGTSLLASYTCVFQ